MTDNMENAWGRSTGATPWRFLELLAVFIAATSIVGLVTMRFGIFHAPQVWIAGFASAYLYSHTTAPSRSDMAEVPHWHLLLVVLVALVFRLPPFTYLLGGQDEGIYMNMGAELARTGGLQPIDTVLQHISNPAVRAQYMAGNYQPIYLPGIYSANDGLEFQFYHLFPVWIALFKAAFGTHGAIYALTFLSIASVVYFQRLALLLSGSAKAGLVAGLLLAVNPLHAFFSKFPVTEVPTLAFSTMAFCFLLKAWRDQDRSAEIRNIVLSTVALGLLFMTRISGFMYLPLIFAVAVAGLLAVPDRKALLLQYWVAGATILYVCSVLYGLKWSSIYAHGIYVASFEPLLGSRWPAILGGVALLAVGFIACLAVACRNGRWRGTLSGAYSRSAFVLPVLLLVFFVISAWKAYRLGFTDAYSHHALAGALSGKRWHAVRSVSLIAASIYLSPFLMLGLFFSATLRGASAELKLLLFFVASFFGYATLLQWYLPYQPYYARYLVSELVPYSILFVVCAWARIDSGWANRVLLALIILGFVSTVVISSFQAGKGEHRGLAGNLDRLASHFDSRDLVLIDRDLAGPMSKEIKTALLYSYGLSVATVGEDELASNRYLSSLAHPYQDVFFISRKTVAPPGFVESDSVEFYEQTFCHGVDVPDEMCVRSNFRLMVYRQPGHGSGIAKPGETALELSTSEAAVQTLVGRKTGAGLLAAGSAGFIMYGPYAQLPSGRYTVVVDGTGTTPFVLDLTAGQGAISLGRKGLAAAESPSTGTLASMDFEVANAVEDLEVRIQVQEGSNLNIQGYRIIRR